MKQYTGIGFALLLVMLLIAGCSSASTANNQTEDVAVSSEQPATEQAVSTQNESTVPEKNESNTRVVATVNGDVEIPANPTRIAATYYAGELAALGYKPSGTATRLLPDASPHLSEYTNEAADLGEFPPNMEAIAAMAPDLIIATDFDELDYDQLSQIAPTVIIPWTDSDVWGKLRAVATLLDKESEAEAYIQQYEDHAATAREAVAGVVAEDETISVIRFLNKSSFRAYAGRDIGHAFYNGLQLQMPQALADQVATNPNLTSTEDLSFEEIGKYTGDRIFIVTTNDEAIEGYKAIKNLAIWKDLPAVKAGKVYELPAATWFTYDPISVQFTLDEAVRLLTEDTQ